MSPEPRDAAVIRTADRRLRVFVSSTLGELAAERQAVAQAESARPGWRWRSASG